MLGLEARQPPPPPSRQPSSAAAAHFSFVDEYCVSCHDEDKKRGGLALEQAAALDVAQQPEIWENVTEEGKAKLKNAADPSLSPEWPVSISIPDWTTYTKEQIVACKGPGE